MPRRFPIIRRALPLILLVAAAVAVLAVARLYISPGKFDWPAWVQAVGSTAAIIAAFLIANQQHVDNLAVEQARRDSDDIRRLDAVRALVANVTMIAADARQYIQSPDFYFSEMSPDKLSFLLDCETAIRGLPIFELPHRDLAIYCINLPQAMKRLREMLEQQNIHVGHPAQIVCPSPRAMEDSVTENIALAAKIGQLCSEAIEGRQGL